LAAVDATITSPDLLMLGLTFGPSQPPTIPAGTTTSADFSTANSDLSITVVAPHPTNDPKAGRASGDTHGDLPG